MSKLNAGKASILAITAVLAITAFFLGKTITKVSAITEVCFGGCPTVEFNAQHEVDVPGYYVYESRTYSEAVYDCDLTVDIHGTSYNVSEFYNKKTGDANHCHRIVWASNGNGQSHLTSEQQTAFEGMHHGNPDYGDPGHGTWGAAYNYHINEVVDAHFIPAGYSACSSEYTVDPDDESKCRKRIDPTYETEYFSKDITYTADGGSCYLPSAESQGVPDWALDDYDELESETTRPVVACTPIDVCLNIPDDQNELPANMQADANKSCSCLPGFHEVEQEVGFSCQADETTPTPTPNPDVCANIDGIQYSVPDGLHLDAGKVNCVSFGVPGVNPPQGGNNPQVLGASTGTGSQVLGASTLAGTGSFEENLYLAIMAIGGFITTLGVANFKKASKLA